jgi:hypothetical protein
MSLAGRLTAFLLVALALVLVGFSVTLYLLARTYLYRQLDDRLGAALHTLSAAADVEPDGVEWEPQQGRLSLGQDADDAQVRWAVPTTRGESWTTRATWGPRAPSRSRCRYPPRRSQQFTWPTGAASRGGCGNSGCSPRAPPFHRILAEASTIRGAIRVSRMRDRGTNLSSTFALLQLLVSCPSTKGSRCGGIKGNQTP